MHSIPGFPQRSITHKLFLTGHTVVFVFWGNLLFVPLAQLYQAAYSLFLRQHFSTSQHTNWHFGPDNLLLVLGWVVLCTVGCFSSIPDLCLPDARSIVPPFLQLWQPRMSPDIAKSLLKDKLSWELVFSPCQANSKLWCLKIHAFAIGKCHRRSCSYIFICFCVF